MSSNKIIIYDYEFKEMLKEKENPYNIKDYSVHNKSYEKLTNSQIDEIITKHKEMKTITIERLQKDYHKDITEDILYNSCIFNSYKDAIEFLTYYNKYSANKYDYEIILLQDSIEMEKDNNSTIDKIYTVGYIVGKIYEDKLEMPTKLTDLGRCYLKREVIDD